jgi:pyruvate/oxaloacetate carboxyltransferase
MFKSCKVTLRTHPALPLRMATLCAGLLLLGACASTPLPPTQQLQAAELAITNAEQARVADFAAEDLNRAREKLNAANTAVQQEDMVQAAYLADEARVSAELASAKTEMLKARAVNEEMQKSIETLKQEIQRNTGTR